VLLESSSQQADIATEEMEKHRRQLPWPLTDSGAARFSGCDESDLVTVGR
jgi:hypothetical protein